MAGVTYVVFRQTCKELGADVMVTEFVSAEGIMRADERTRKYTDFSDEQRPLGVQLFGADGARMGEAARKIIGWKAPDFIDLNFGCPVNKVVAKNGGSSLLKDCPLLERVASDIVKALAPTGIPVTAKIRIGWDQETINAPRVAKLLENCGIQALTVHGRTRAQGYSGAADWDVIAQCAEAVRIPVIGNGDLSSGADIARRRAQSDIRGVMIGRAALAHPWIFHEAKEFLATGTPPASVSVEARWELIVRHTRMALDRGLYGSEKHTLQHMRGRLMAYTHGLRGAKRLRQRFSTITSLTELQQIAELSLAEEAASEAFHAEAARIAETSRVAESLSA